MAQANYNFAKRQRDLAKIKKREEKRLKKASRRTEPSPDAPSPPPEEVKPAGF
ncbi:MAG: hypothetical protein V1929_12490 [bacterium]